MCPHTLHILNQLAATWIWFWKPEPTQQQKNIYTTPTSTPPQSRTKTATTTTTNNIKPRTKGIAATNCINWLWVHIQWVNWESTILDCSVKQQQTQFTELPQFAEFPDMIMIYHDRGDRISLMFTIKQFTSLVTVQFLSTPGGLLIWVDWTTAGPPAKQRLMKTEKSNGGVALNTSSPGCTSICRGHRSRFGCSRLTLRKWFVW